MKKTVNFYDFEKTFSDFGRGEQFSRAGLSALFDYLEEYEEETGQELELDVIGLCCDFTEYENLEEFKEDYKNLDIDNLDDIRDHTTVIDIDGEAFIIQAF